MADDDTGTSDDQQQDDKTDDSRDWKTEYERLQQESRKWEERAKANAPAVKELEKLRRESMTELERVREEGKSEGRTEAARTVASRLVTAEVRAAAAGRPLDVAALLEGFDPTRFMTDDGEPDAKAITKWLDRIAPVGERKFPDLGQGVRGSEAPQDMNALIRRQAGVS